MYTTRRAAFLAVIASAGLVACGSGSNNTDAGPDASTSLQIFDLAADNIHGVGSLLGVWVASNLALATNQVDQRAYIVGGFVGVPASVLPAGSSRGQLMGWDGTDQIRTLCRTDSVLRVVYSERGLVFAAGDSAKIVTYDPRTHGCTETAVGSFGPDAAVSITAIAGMAADGNQVFAVGSVTDSSGVRALIYRFDGTSWSEVTIPTELRSVALTGVAYQNRIGFWVVAENGAAMKLPTGSSEWVLDPIVIPMGLGPVRGVSIEANDTPSSRDWTMAAGGTSSPFIVARNVTDPTWTTRETTGMPVAPVYAVRVESECEAYFVGKGGSTSVYNARAFYSPSGAPLTTHDLYAVHSTAGYKVAVGGDITDATVDQPGVILIRGDNPRTSYFVNGQAYAAVTPMTTVDFGGCGPQ